MKKMNWTWIFFFAFLSSFSGHTQTNDTTCRYTDSLRAVLRSALKKSSQLTDKIQQMGPEFELAVKRKFLHELFYDVEGFEVSRDIQELQTPIDIRTDSLADVWLTLHSNRIDAEESIVLLKKEAERFHEICAIENVKNKTVVIYSQGGYLMEGPEYNTEIISPVPKDSMLIISTEVSINSYIRASYLQYRGFIHIGVLEQSPELKLILRKPENVALQTEDVEYLKKLYSQEKDSVVVSESPQEEKRNSRKGSHRRKYYVNTRGKKVYSKERVIN